MKASSKADTETLASEEKKKGQRKGMLQETPYRSNH
jgi:hypothetical protein